MGKKKDKGKAIQEDSDSPTKALSEHSEDLTKTPTLNTITSKDLQKWIEQLSQSPEVLKALQGIASSSTEDAGMSSKLKTIVPVHGTASLSQTVDSKDLSNPLMAVDLPKIQYTPQSSDSPIKPSSSKPPAVSSDKSSSKPSLKGKAKWADMASSSSSTSSSSLVSIKGKLQWPTKHYFSTVKFRGKQSNVHQQ
ncbi:hypothetical protein JCGZ_23618 [Jatropha curcas]|uniref:Uncharacterized protein n=1 Tax=Jatropha curcas TaxID=180498 RepID=A0A067L648_JATCU|nr:hypothetical protein JCGZ_23618 [Jatropha curcas]